MKSHNLFNAMNQDNGDKKAQQSEEKKDQLKSLKKSAKELLAHHNPNIRQIWNILYEISVAEKLLKEMKSADDEIKIKIIKKIQVLKDQEVKLREKYDIKESENLIKDKYAEIEKLEKELNPDKAINFDSPYKF